MRLTSIMAKRLSKALRGKRRWIGVLLSSQFNSRKDVETKLSAIFSDSDLTGSPKLMDFSLGIISNGCSTGVLQVKLEDYSTVRTRLENIDSLEKLGISSVTSSGKIRLVRQRLSKIE